jgi:hypothetical protein
VYETGSTTPLAIERVDFASSNTTLNQFVVILEDEMDNTNEYELFFNLNQPDETLNVKASIILAMDTEAPEIQFISPTGIVGKDAADRIIEVAWGVPFDQNSFPRFRATDDRDGDLTSFVFVPKGQYSVLNTAEEGDYTIMLEVSDKWGNVTQETFIFRVVKE